MRALRLGIQESARRRTTVVVITTKGKLGPGGLLLVGRR